MSGHGQRVPVLSVDNGYSFVSMGRTESRIHHTYNPTIDLWDGTPDGTVFSGLPFHSFVVSPTLSVSGLPPTRLSVTLYSLQFSRSRPT